MRIELHNVIDGVVELQKLCNKAKEDRFDAVFVPPVFVHTAAELLGRNDITIVTTAGQGDDLLDTKLMGIESAARAGAEEVIVPFSRYSIHDENWLKLEKELRQIRQMGEVHRVFIWVRLSFANLSRSTQVTICDMLGKLGLRSSDPSVNDIKLAKICEVHRFCVSLAMWDLEPKLQQELSEAGADQFVLCDKPEQLKTTNVQRTEINL